MTDPGPAPPPPFAGFLLDALRSARAGWEMRHLFLLWVILFPAYLLFGSTSSLSGLWRGSLGAWLLGSLGVAGWVVLALLAAVLIAAGLAAAGMICGAAGWEYGRECRWRLSESLAMLRGRAQTLYLAVLAIPLAALAILALIVLGCLAVGWIPYGIGTVLAGAWLTLGGLPLAAVTAGFLILGVPALLLVVPAAALDGLDAFDAVSRSMSYVRSRPLKFLLSLAASQAAALFSAAIVALFFLLIAACLLLAYMVGADRGSLAQLPDHLGALLGAFDPCWPVPVPSGPPGSAAFETYPLLGFLAAALGRFATAAYCIASLTALTRTFLYLRWDLDQELPSCLVRHDEVFRWED